MNTSSIDLMKDLHYPCMICVQPQMHEEQVSMKQMNSLMWLSSNEKQSMSSIALMFPGVLWCKVLAKT